MSTSSGDDDFSSAASLSAGDVSDGCDCDDCFLGISDMMSSVLRNVPMRKLFLRSGVRRFEECVGIAFPREKRRQEGKKCRRSLMSCCASCREPFSARACFGRLMDWVMRRYESACLAAKKATTSPAAWAACVLQENAAVCPSVTILSPKSFASSSWITNPSFCGTCVEDVSSVPHPPPTKIASPDSSERVPQAPPRLADDVPTLPQKGPSFLDRLVLLPPPLPAKVATEPPPPCPRLGPWSPPPFASFASDPGPPDLDLLKMSLREYKKALAASRKSSSGGERTTPMTGYEMYRLSLLKQLAGAEYADASSDDLSSDWEEPDDAHKVKKSFLSRRAAPVPPRGAYRYRNRIVMAIDRNVLPPFCACPNVLTMRGRHVSHLMPGVVVISCGPSQVVSLEDEDRKNVSADISFDAAAAPCIDEPASSLKNTHLSASSRRLCSLL
ncbi:hypothetical protein HPB50_022579 [Hyalomma asiaticum]|uniref:Uncharacterized protein n=1 Tax=Hyalomma asiaticum TaxID=266040 RepID=A0ACB7RZK9_HYAAI|nr:hypothetical protein HPB50_022579 [Hyalomma asiaticum]